MKDNINITNNFSIGIDTDINGIGLGRILTPQSRIYIITLFTVFLYLKFPRLKNIKIEIFKMVTSEMGKYDGKLFSIIPHETFSPQYIYVRESNGNYIKVDDFSIFKNGDSVRGVVVKWKNTNMEHFFRPDEFTYTKQGDLIKGYIKNREIVLLSIKDDNTKEEV